MTPNQIPDGASYLRCSDIQGELNGMYAAGRGDSLECLKVGTGFDDVRSIETRNGKVTFGG